MNECFARLKRFVKRFHVTNDVFEHTIQLVTDFNDRITSLRSNVSFRLQALPGSAVKIMFYPVVPSNPQHQRALLADLLDPNRKEKSND